MSVASAPPTRLIAFSSGKGGVGKTFLSLNVAAALAMSGRSVLLFDGDLGLANVHVLLGMQPKLDLSDALAGRCTIGQTLLDGPSGVKVLPGASGNRGMAELTTSEMTQVIQAIDGLTPAPDYMLIDTGAGIGTQVTTLARLADSIVVVVRDEPASLADAYGLIKVMHQDFGSRNIDIVVNDAADVKRGEAVYHRLSQVATQFLGLPLTLAGVVPHENATVTATRRRETLLTAAPHSAAAIAIRQIAARLETSRAGSSGPRFLVDRLGPAERTDAT
jgi:flagellar biosynthesis protein FlhG